MNETNLSKINERREDFSAQAKLRSVDPEMKHHADLKEKLMTTRNLCTFAGVTACLLLLTASSAWAHCAGKHTGNHPHCQGSGGGGEDPIFTAESADPYIPAVDSYDVFQETTIVFRDAQFDLSQFEGTWDNSGTACNHGFTGGTFSIKPKSDATPDLALLTATFQSELETGKLKTHVFTMEGLFDEPVNWPPSSGDPDTSITFDYWEVKAENKKAQRDDCAGEGNGSWTVSVTRQP